LVSNERGLLQDVVVFFPMLAACDNQHTQSVLTKG